LNRVCRKYLESAQPTELPMTWWQAIILGLVQGLTEFLPVSSSGHLVLGQHLLGIALTDDVAFEVMLHLGTAGSIITVYHARIGTLVGQMVRSLPHAANRTDPEVRLGWQIALSCVPVGLAYVLLGDMFEAAFMKPRLACAMLLVTGGLLWLTRLAPTGQRATSAWTALLTGVAQVAALLPGISRSGATICTGLYLRVDPEAAADFSFLMVLPPIAGAALLKVTDMTAQVAAVDWVHVLVGTAVAYASGVLAIRVVLNFVRRGRLHYFAYYCVGVGLLGWLLLSAGSAP